MSRADRSPPLSLRLFRMGVTAGAVIAAAAGANVALSMRVTPPASSPPLAVRRAVAGAPIAWEADVFRTHPGELAVDTGAARRPEAHPRTLATFRGLRAYPGAPPRIPHGLTATEYRTTGCNACHERAGYSLRFGAYVPATPHPELVDCLSCHLPDDAMVGEMLPARGPEGQCGQCHAPAKVVGPLVALDWRAGAWPVVDRRPADGSPPPIPHDVAFRGNCNACHMGPAAVAEIRTDHPARADCRACHLLQSSDTDAFVRPGGEP